MFAQTIPADWDDPSLEVVKQTVLRRLVIIRHNDQRCIGTCIFSMPCILNGFSSVV